MNQRPLGLRFKILISLTILIALLSCLLGFAIISISSVAILKERRLSIKLAHITAARSIASAIASGTSATSLNELASFWIESKGIDGIWIFGGSGQLFSKLTNSKFEGIIPKPLFPLTELYEDVNLELKGKINFDRRHKHIITQYPIIRPSGCIIVGTHADKISKDINYLGILLIIYLMVHGIAILIFGYFSLTNLIIKPIEILKNQTEKLGEGKFEFEVDLIKSGSAEIVEFARAIKAASLKLKEQRDDLINKIDQLEKARSEILKSQEALLKSQKLASVGRLTAGLAHEIGNPLTSIIGFTDLISDNNVSYEEKKEYISRMKSEAERMNRIIRDLLTYARAEGKEITSVQIEDAILEACNIMKPQKLFKRVEIITDFEKNIPPVLANRDRLIQVMVNLLMNAAEAMVGEGKIIIKLKKLEEPARIQLTVEDTGTGIPEEIKGEIFEPFVTTKPHGQGTGLGLSVCYGIIKSLGGSITAENKPEGGACFTIQIPVENPSEK